MMEEKVESLNENRVVVFAGKSKKEEKKCSSPSLFSLGSSNDGDMWHSLSLSMQRLKIHLQSSAQLTYKQLLKLSQEGNEDAKKLIKWLRKSGMRNAHRNHAEAEKLYGKIPWDMKTIPNLSKFREEMTASHIKPRSSFEPGKGQKESGYANNIEFEPATENMARGNKAMSPQEQLVLSARQNLKMVGRAALSGAKNGAAISGAISLVQHGYSWLNGSENFSEAAKSVVEDTVAGGFQGALLNSVCTLCPPISTLYSIYTVYTLAKATRLDNYIYEYMFQEKDIPEFPENSIIIIDNNLCASCALPVTESKTIILQQTK
jgi:hypothetical protein